MFAVGLQKILSLLESEDADVRVHAVKVVANLAAEGPSYIISMRIECSCVQSFFFSIDCWVLFLMFSVDTFQHCKTQPEF